MFAAGELEFFNILWLLKPNLICRYSRKTHKKMDFCPKRVKVTILLEILMCLLVPKHLESTNVLM